MSSIGTCSPLSASNRQIAFLPLPNKHIAEIFSHIHLTDIQSLPPTSKAMRREIVLYMNGAKCEEVAKFLKKVIQGLDPANHHAQIESLQVIYSELEEAFSQKPLFISIFNPFKLSPKNSLVGLKDAIILTKDRIIDVLKSLDYKAFYKIEQIPLPSFFEKIFGIVRTCKRIPLTDGVLSESTEEILSDFAKIGGINQAIAVANTLPPAEEVDAIRYIVNTLSSPAVMKMDTAFQIVNNNLEGNSRIEALLEFITSALKSRKYDHAIKAAQALPSDLAAEELIRIAQCLDTRRQYDQKREVVRIAAEAASATPDEFWKITLLAHIAKWFLHLNNYDGAKELFKAAFKIAKRLPNGDEKACALARIIDSLIRSQKERLVVLRIADMEKIKKEFILTYLIHPTTASERVLAKVKDEMDNADVYELVSEDLTDQIEAKLWPNEMPNSMPDNDEKS